MNEELKPCPFCGSNCRVDNTTAMGAKNGERLYWAVCENGKCALAFDIPSDSFKDAIKAWNTRYQDPETIVLSRKELEEMKYAEIKHTQALEVMDKMAEALGKLHLHNSSMGDTSTIVDGELITWDMGLEYCDSQFYEDCEQALQAHKQFREKA